MMIMVPMCSTMRSFNERKSIPIYLTVSINLFQHPYSLKHSILLSKTRVYPEAASATFLDHSTWKMMVLLCNNVGEEVQPENQA